MVKKKKKRDSLMFWKVCIQTLQFNFHYHFFSEVTWSSFRKSKLCIDFENTSNRLLINSIVLGMIWSLSWLITPMIMSQWEPRVSCSTPKFSLVYYILESIGPCLHMYLHVHIYILIFLRFAFSLPIRVLPNSF